MGGWWRMYDEGREFLKELQEGDPPTLPRLIEMLEGLKSVYRATPKTDPPDWFGSAPEKDYQQTYGKLCVRFPEYGYYPVTEPGDPEGTESYLGDSIDDLADIVGDISEAIWLYENVNEAEAQWQFRFSYEIHWGIHLAKLLLYLKAGAPRHPI